MISESTRLAVDVVNLVEVVHSTLDVETLTDEDFASACQTLLFYASNGPPLFRLTVESIVRTCRPAALALTAGDYHWYRREADGTWTHKPGQERHRRLTASNLQPYPTFGGYFCACPR